METYYGVVWTLAEAILLAEACRLGILSPLRRQLSNDEIQSIRPGSSYVWDERKVDIEQWDDGRALKITSADRYLCIGRELEGRKYKTAGLVKLAFRITSCDQYFRLVSYYSSSYDGPSELQRPKDDPRLRNIVIDQSLYREFNLNNVVKPRAPVVPQNYQPGAGHLGPTRPNYNDAAVQAQPLSFIPLADKIDAEGTDTRADECAHAQYRVPVAQSTTSGHIWSNRPQVGQVALPTADPMSNAPISLSVQASIAPAGVNVVSSKSSYSHASGHGSNVAGSSRAPSTSKSANGLVGEDKRMMDLLNHKIRG